MKRLMYGFVVLLLLSGAPALAAKPSSGGGGGVTPATGVDVSYPQCSSVAGLPLTAAFGIVGINGGKASNANPCLRFELTWASGLIALGSQPKVAQYVNTGNPGDVELTDPSLVSFWPTSGTTPYGSCDTLDVDSAACGYLYGYHMGAQDTVQASAGGGILTNSNWWLDVESSNSWTTDPAKNRASLEGMTAGIKASAPGIVVGIYSTNSQWSGIAGKVPPGSSLYIMNEWLPGAKSLKTAISNCSLQPFTGGGNVSLTQYTSTLDYDYSCAD